MKTFALILLIGNCAQSENLPPSPAPAQVKKEHHLSALEKDRIITLYAQGFEALGQIHIEGHAFQGSQYWIAAVNAMIAAPNNRLTQEQQSFINDFNLLASITVKHLKQSFEAKKGLPNANLIVEKFFTIAEDMIKKYPDGQRLLIHSSLAQNFIDNEAQVTDIVKKADEIREKSNLEGAALGKHFIETAKKIRCIKYSHEN